MANRTGKGTFVKGDPRINRKGKPRDFAGIRTLVQSVGNEIAKDKDGNPIIIDGHVATVAEMIVRSWAKDNKHQVNFIEYGYGKVPNPVELTGKDGEAIIVDDKRDEILRKLAGITAAGITNTIPTEPNAG